MIVAEQEFGANGVLGVCTRCHDLVPTELDGEGRSVCANGRGDPQHVEGFGRQAWTPTKNHKTVVLSTPESAFCRRCRWAVGVDGAGRCKREAAV